MNKFMVGLASVVLVVLGSLAEAAEMKIGVVDLHKILKQSPEVAVINDQLKSEFKPRGDKIAAAEKDLNDKASKLERDGAVMNTQEREKLAVQVQSERRKLYRMQQDFHDDLSYAEQQATQKLLAKVEKAINKVAKQNQYDLVLQKNGVPYSSASVDITAAVINALKQS